MMPNAPRSIAACRRVTSCEACPQMTDTPGPKPMRASSKSEVTAMTATGLDIEDATDLKRLNAPALTDAFPQLTTTSCQPQDANKLEIRHDAAPWFTGAQFFC